MTTHIVIMAAGKGTRMNSLLPKVMHELGGISMIDRVVTTARETDPDQIIVVTGYGAEIVEVSIMEPKPTFARQEPQLGTGHAVQQVLPHLKNDGITVIVNGDTPLIKADTIHRLIDRCLQSCLTLLTVELEDPTGYGRIIRERHGAVTGIVEHKDATDEQKKVREVYTGMMAVSTVYLREWLAKLTNNNAQKEYYLTDIVWMAMVDGIQVATLIADSKEEVMGVNTPEQLAELEKLV